MDIRVNFFKVFVSSFLLVFTYDFVIYQSCPYLTHMRLMQLVLDQPCFKRINWWCHSYA